MSPAALLLTTMILSVNLWLALTTLGRWVDRRLRQRTSILRRLMA